MERSHDCCMWSLAGCFLHTLFFRCRTSIFSQVAFACRDPRSIDVYIHEFRFCVKSS